MSREIKFRAWDGHQMLSQNVLYWDSTKFVSGLWVNAETHIEHEDQIEVQVMQYTGLKDCNGVEIYEGDIAVLEDIKPKEVIWFDGRFWLKDSLLIISQVEIDCGLEVVGNIYEHPELLNT